MKLKTCTKCQRQLPLNCFYPRSTVKDGFRQPCKECTAKQLKEYRERPENLVRKRQVSREYYRKPGVRERVLAKSKQHRYKNHIKHKFGLSEQDIKDMLTAQNNRCAICLEPFLQTPQVDHNHTTGKVRALLCSLCNHGIGNFKENCTRLINAVNYLNKYNTGVHNENDS